MPLYEALAVEGCTRREGAPLPQLNMNRPVAISTANANVCFMAGTVIFKLGFVKSMIPGNFVQHANLEAKTRGLAHSAEALYGPELCARLSNPRNHPGLQIF
jgi:hypothetical protein